MKLIVGFKYHYIPTIHHAQLLCRLTVKLYSEIRENNLYFLNMRGAQCNLDYITIMEFSVKKFLVAFLLSTILDTYRSSFSSSIAIAMCIACCRS